MLLTITTTHQPATDLGYLLHKNPANLRSVPLSFGTAHVFYPEASEERCTAALLLEVDPVGLVRGRRGPPGEDGLFTQYVNDRPFVASSFLSTAINKLFGTAMSGTSKERPELVDTPLPLEVSIPAIRCVGGESVLREFFEPLGYQVQCESHALDPEFPEWGNSRVFSVTLKGTLPLREMLNHLYVLIPVLDDGKHFWVGKDEVETLLRKGEGWLKEHPHREQILHRGLARRRGLARLALERLDEGEPESDDEHQETAAEQEASLEKPIRLNQRRMDEVVERVKALSASTLIDIGCGEGKFLKRLLDVKALKRIVGVDASHRALEKAATRLKLDWMPATQRERIEFLHGSLTYRDERFAGFDVATLIEVIEHLELERLPALERVVFEFARPQAVIVTTPNIEFNATFESMPEGTLRNWDHRFEWTREEFQAWANRIAESFGYAVVFHPIGDEHPEYGPPTQMAVFELQGGEA